MGIDTHGVRLLQFAYRKHGAFGETVTIGHQGLHVAPKALCRYFGSQVASSEWVDELLHTKFGATTVRSIDMSSFEGADFIADMNLPLPDDIPAFDTVIDGGSLEHIFDVRTSFANIARLCRIGGQVVHALPANNYIGHGFYQFSPEFFYSVYSPNRGFADTTVHLVDRGKPNDWWYVRPPLGGQRNMVLTSHETYALVRTRRVSDPAGDGPVQQSDYVHSWVRGAPGQAGGKPPRNIYSDPTNSSLLPEGASLRLAQLVKRVRWGLNQRNPHVVHVRAPERKEKPSRP